MPALSGLPPLLPEPQALVARAVLTGGRAALPRRPIQNLDRLVDRPFRAGANAEPEAVAQPGNARYRPQHRATQAPTRCSTAEGGDDIRSPTTTRWPARRRRDRTGSRGHDDGRRVGELRTTEVAPHHGGRWTLPCGCWRGCPTASSRGSSRRARPHRGRQRDRGREILCRDRATCPTRYSARGVEARSADLGRVGQAFMQGADIGEAAARRDDGEGCARRPP